MAGTDNRIWELWEMADGSHHIIPTNDAREHDHDEDCWCDPQVGGDGALVIHNAVDGRENATITKGTLQ